MYVFWLSSQLMQLCNCALDFIPISNIERNMLKYHSPLEIKKDTIDTIDNLKDLNHFK